MKMGWLVCVEGISCLTCDSDSLIWLDLHNNFVSRKAPSLHFALIFSFPFLILLYDASLSI
jgi:hypothetical protein